MVDVVAADLTPLYERGEFTEDFLEIAWTITLAIIYPIHQITMRMMSWRMTAFLSAETSPIRCLMVASRTVET